MNYNIYSNKMHHKIVKNNSKLGVKSRSVQISNDIKVPDRYIISGIFTSNPTQFYITINNIIEENENGEINIMIGKRYPIHIENDNFTCNLDILPTSLNFMFIQNIDDLQNIKHYDDLNKIKWNVPKISNIKLCDIKYISEENMKYMYFGL